MMTRQLATLVLVLLATASQTSAQSPPPNAPPQVAGIVGAITDNDAYAAAPEELRRILDGGSVYWHFYDPARERSVRPGLTRFDIQVNHHYSMRYRRVREFRRKARLIVTCEVDKVDLTLLHVVKIPHHLNRADRWDDLLVRHELDHVAVSADPRPALLLEHLFRKLPSLVLEAPADDRQDEAAAHRGVDAELVARRTAVNALLQANYALLDQVSRHGVVAIPERADFLRSLYTKANLDQHAFPYTGDALDLLASDEYRNAELLYDLPAEGP